MIVGISSQPPRTIEELLPPRLAAALDRLDVLSRKVLSGKMPGERRSKRRGRSVEFDDFRQYVPGDDPRHIDWNVLARLDKLVIKLFREEEDLALHLIVDSSKSMDAGEPSKRVTAHRLALALAYIGLVNHNRVSIATFGHDTGQFPGTVRRLAPLRGRRSVQRAGAFLVESLRSSDGTTAASRAENSFPDSMLAASRGLSGRGITLILTDALFDGIEQGLNYATGVEGPGTYDTYIVQVLAPSEIDPLKERDRGLVGDLRLTDAESGRGIDVTVAPATIMTYREGIRGHIERVRRACMARGISHSLIESNADIEQVLVGTLRKGGLLR